ncbi:MAG: hypothetical protein J6T44_09950 [Prevotella sp.]|nr:hypothetical protein [Prevotella sp.]
MKLRYFIPSLIAVLAAVFTGCSDDQDETYLDEIRVSQSYLSLNVNGGSVSIDVYATGAWSVTDVPDWLTVSPASGSGSGTITFSAGEGVGRTAEVLINCEGKVQHINIIQGIATVSTATCAEVLAGPESKTYRVTGTCTKIANTTYGNWYLDDGTGEVYIYGTLDSKGGTKNFLSWGLEVGDQVTVEGPKTVYNGTVELVDVTVVKIVKSLIKCDSLTVNGAVADELPLEGGEIVANLTCKGNGVAVEIPAEAQSWLGVVGTTFGENPKVTFRVAPNDGDSRNATVIFKTTDGKKEYTSQATIKQKAFKLPKGKNPADPFTVAEAIKKCQEIGSTTDGEIYYAKGKISSIKEISTSYGNGTFNISDDGTDNNALTCYRSFFLDKEKFTAEDQVAVGDEVIVCGKLVNYTDKNGVVTPEFSGDVYIYSIKKGSGAGGNDGSLAKPYNVAEITAITAQLEKGETSEADCYFKGKISTIKYTFSAQYGTATFFISDDGAAANEFQIYSAYYYGGQAWVEGNTQIAVGDEVVIFGKVCNYNGTLETASKKAYVYSINGKTN